jgi:hypothetical protein
VDAAVGREAVDRPIDQHEVRTIASKGYPLWESVEVMQLRNRRITLAYGDLSVRLADLLAGPDGERQGNWCTFATWSSKTIGTLIEDGPDTPLTDRIRARTERYPLLERALVGAAHGLRQRGEGASYRSLAAGNRYVFLEIGLAAAVFLERFEHLAAEPREKRQGVDGEWDQYWGEVKTILDEELGRLDPSWLLTESPDQEALRLGLFQYHCALYEQDTCMQAQLVLAGNLLLGAYEQQRVDGYVAASLALFSRRAMRNLVRVRTGVLDGWARLPSAGFARLMTLGMALTTPDEHLRVCRPLPAPPGGPTVPLDLQQITYPLLQALLTRWDLSQESTGGRGVRNWASLDERMNYIANLFRSRQQHQCLFDDPFDEKTEAALLAGELVDEPRPPVDPD